MKRQVELVLLAILSLAAGQTWVVEPIDSVLNGTEFFLRRHPDGRLIACYTRPDTSFRLAWKDSVWHLEDLPFSGTLMSFDVGRHGEEAVCFGRVYEILQLAIRRDSGWQLETLNFGADSRPYVAVCALDTAGWPRVAYSYVLGAPWSHMIFLQKTPTGWQVYPRVWDCCSPAMLRTDPLDRPLRVSIYWYQRPDDRLGYQYDLQAFYELCVRDTWREYARYGGGDYWWLGAFSAAVDSTLQPHATCCEQPCGPHLFFLDRTQLDTLVTGAALAYDRENRPQIACLRGNELLHRYLGASGWHFSTVPGHFAPYPVDMVLDSLDQPMILCNWDGTLSLARGDNVVGVADLAVPTEPWHSECDFVRAGSELRCAGPGRLLDVSGRVVLRLRAGANDTRGLAPGVYHCAFAGTRRAGRIIVSP